MQNIIQFLIVSTLILKISQHMTKTLKCMNYTIKYSILAQIVYVILHHLNHQNQNSHQNQQITGGIKLA